MAQHEDRKDWRKWKAEKKALKRKYKEEKLIQKLEREKKRKEEEKDENDVKESPKELSGRDYTVSIALPGSILDNAQSPELRTYLAGQIARAAVVFNVDEIVVFDDSGSNDRKIDGHYDGIGKKGHANVQLARILQYLECPQYLRKSFFPQHKDLHYAGLLNPLDCPHHMRTEDKFCYREGVVLDKPVTSGRGSYVNIGLAKEVQIDRQLQAGVRVTVKLDQLETGKKKFKGIAVPPSAPRTCLGKYWGYSVRIASSLSAVLTGCLYKGGYDLTIGTSERGVLVDDISLPKFKHAIVVFGGVKGLEAGLEADENVSIDDPKFLFHHYVNTCPSQGSRTIRTEEAILISMSTLRPKFETSQKKNHIS
ncbi:hypothetical protein ScPMuIL_002694 [Solemya velum]